MLLEATIKGVGFSQKEISACVDTVAKSIHYLKTLEKFFDHKKSMETVEKNDIFAKTNSHEYYLVKYFGDELIDYAGSVDEASHDN